MISFGITGIIGSGKSMLSQIFQSMGVPVYNADANAKVLMNSDEVIRQRLVGSFGSAVYADGRIDKAFLANRIFSDENARMTVNSIVHPVVKNDFLSWRASQKTDFVAIESAILFEAGIEDILDYVVFVDADEKILVDRICKRDNVSGDVALSKIRIQRAASGKERCDFVFTNDFRHSLIEQAESFINNLKCR
ncbi:MAG: dephospho-CoA kinase [Bacteroidales bacterium]|nr:dephospho-CoA kinase [Bacteroidales bacterium]